MKKYTLLEFNEEQQMFHYNTVINNIPETLENSNGYKTLIVCDSLEQACLFADFLFTQHLEDKKATFKDLDKTVNNLIQFTANFIK